MQELSMEEIEQVNGGVIPLGIAVALHIAGNIGSGYAWYRFAQDMR
ncbi:class IIb bacteriocin, lactobin A/cerein 7B family [Shewanella benthica]|uniref:Class IIb bacteriocin, lactobin A/cerein 7B family protein n=1 Tax=Shewanella benthica KT99 TaxID=314608 RepID=A9D927_9GAMM|nr:class IIb bacteriocin, lactobin A/cerein 7B family [Shewanella benthica]EDQ00907.1 hypothetical protein KT99_05422 [Shewanella benthica KT99]